MDTTKSTACPKCGKETRIVKRMKDRERGVPGGIYISCSGCEFFEKLLVRSPIVNSRCESNQKRAFAR
jgi:hypothetical protein